MTTTAMAASELLDAAWGKLPPAYRPPAEPPSLEQARAWCRHLTETHYENFHVASYFLPAKYRPDFHAVYAYCRVADDLGDEVGDSQQSLALLDYWQQQLNECYAGHATHPVFVALAATIAQCEIPQQPFDDLLVAFRQDQHVTRYQTMAEVMQYCRYSADPVGRLVLYIWGYRDAERQQLSDQTCSALQLANFWQDVVPDYARGRIYIPVEVMERSGVCESAIAVRAMSGEFHDMMRSLVADARAMLQRGAALQRMVGRDLAVDLDLFTRGGLEILRAIERQDYDVLRSRPEISKSRKALLLGRAVGARFLGLGR